MEEKTPVVIVITDELESVSKDKSANNKQELVERRKELFVKQVKSLVEPGSGWTVIKSVGDSLIIRLDLTKGQLAKSLKCCLRSLLNAQTLLYNKNEDATKAGPIRIAVHFTYLEKIVTGQELKPLKKALQDRKMPSGVILEPFLNSIEYDIFGSDMNRAARLASIPEKGLFVVSDEVMDNLCNKKQKETDSPLELKLDRKTFAWARAFPLTDIKGFTKYTYRFPWPIWEIIPHKTNQNSLFYLGPQLKELQAIKVVVAKLHTVEAKTLAVQSFQKILRDNRCPLYVDLVFKIKHHHELFASVRNRKFDEQIAALKDKIAALKDKITAPKNKAVIWKEEISEEIAGLISCYIMFTSVPNIRVNRQLREYFAPKDAKNPEWSFQLVSYDIYESFKINSCLKENKDLTSCKYFFLLLFQIRNDFAKDADNLRRFFEEKQEEPLLIQNGYGDILPFAYGLIEGDVDGFVLFGANGRGTNLAERLREIIQNNVLLASGFFTKVAPISLYELEPLRMNKDKKDNLEYLKLVRKKHDKEKEEEKKKKD